MLCHVLDVFLNSVTDNYPSLELSNPFFVANPHNVLDSDFSRQELINTTCLLVEL